MRKREIPDEPRTKHEAEAMSDKMLDDKQHHGHRFVTMTAEQKSLTRALLRQTHAIAADLIESHFNPDRHVPVWNLTADEMNAPSDQLALVKPDAA